MFSEELLELDRNTVEFMIEDMRRQIEEKDEQIKQLDEQIKQKELRIKDYTEKARKMGRRHLSGFFCYDFCLYFLDFICLYPHIFSDHSI